MISFIIIFHPKRLDNLKQTLHFLKQRENSDIEVILCCQTYIKYFDSPFNNTKFINLESNTYLKPKMTNIGVKAAQNDIIVLLDSDRVLPTNYFTNTCSQLNPNEIITTKNLYYVLNKYNNAQIESGLIKKISDFRSEKNESMKKNLFSGNTIMWKSDYLRIGGYDENFAGYGFADNDMTKNALENGLTPIFLEENELHLYHDDLFDFNNQLLSRAEYKIICAINGLKYFNKWQLKFDLAMEEFINIVNINLSRYKTSHVNEFIRQLSIYNNSFKLCTIY